LSEQKTIRVYREILGESARTAAEIRRLLAEKKSKMINIIGSPGCGKTSLIEHIAKRKLEKLRFAVIEGDVETTRDAERLAAYNVRVSQLITGGGCHLEAKMIYRAMMDLDLASTDVVIVENVGNLVCPAEFDIGEHAKVAVLSVTEGEDKPLKYPLLFREAKCCIITKIDLLPHLVYDVNACLGFIREVNEKLPVFRVSSRTGEGVDGFVDWLSSLDPNAGT
jgi:hydrogenase nickel incorporation protein HypB